MQLQETYYSASAAAVGIGQMLSMLWARKGEPFAEKYGARDGHHRVCLDMKHAGMAAEAQKHGCWWYQVADGKQKAPPAAAV